MEINTIAIDLAKNVFALCAANAAGELIWRKELRRAQLLSFMRRQRPCVVGMEACGGAHYWARQFAAMGYAIRLVSPALVTPYRKGNKTDRNDAEAILEAVTRPSMRFVAVKSVAQQDLLALHRVRSQLLKNRTALCNQLRGLLRERGVAVRAGVTALKRALPTVLADENSEVSGEIRDLLGEMSEWLRTLEARIASCDVKLARKFKADERCVRLAKVPGIGPLAATALVAAVGNAQEFKNGRELSAFLGLVPRQHSSGGKRVLLGITKRGDRYLRTLLIHGARASLRWSALKQTRTVVGPLESKRKGDRMLLRLPWLTKTRVFCGRCLIGASDVDQITRHIAQFRVPALHPQLRERGPQNCAWSKTE